jgi:hypothetical protein
MDELMEAEQETPLNDYALTEDDIVAQLWAGEQECDTFRSTELADRQTIGIEYYDAQPMGDEIDGRSKYIEPVVAEVCDDMEVAILEAFVSGDNVVEFEAGDTQDSESGETFAAEATALVNYYFFRKMDGEAFLVDFLQSGLKEVIGIAKVAYEEEAVKTRETVTVPDELLGTLSEEELGQVVASTDNGDGSHTLEITKTKTQKCFKVYAIPSEEFLFPRRMKTIDDKVYRAHVTYPSISDLIAMGFDRDQVEDLPDDGGNAELRDTRTAARWRDDGIHTHNRAELRGNNRRVRMLEEFDYFDIDGDGMTEMCRVFRVGKDILRRDGELSFEPWDEQMFATWCPFPVAHKMVGGGLAEKVIPDQRLESVITRNLLDGLFATNRPRYWLPSESDDQTNTIQDLLDVNLTSGIVRGRGLQPPQLLSQAFDISKSQALIADFRNRRQSRTGILQLSKGMDKDALNETMGGQDQLMAAGEKKQKYIARNFARALAQVFMKMFRLMRKHGDPVTLKVDGQYKTIDPKQWPEEMDFSLKVGLGTNGKERRIGHRMAIASLQAQAIGAGLPVVTPINIYNTGAGLVRDMALGEPDDFWTHPERGEQKPEQEKPDPEMQKVQAQLAMQQQKQESDQQLAQDKAAFEAELAQDKATTEMQLAREQMQAETQLAREELMMNAELQAAQIEQGDYQHSEKLASSERMANIKLSTNKPGGSLSE